MVERRLDISLSPLVERGGNEHREEALRWKSKGRPRAFRFSEVCCATIALPPVSHKRLWRSVLA